MRPLFWWPLFIFCLAAVPWLTQVAESQTSNPLIWRGANAYDITSGGVRTPILTIPESQAVTGAQSALIVSPALSSDYTLTLPIDDGAANECLTTDGSGALTWTPRISTSLANGSILIGSAGGVATANAVTGDISLSNAGVTAIGSGVIVNADVNASAAIDGSKIVAATGAVSGVVSTTTQTFAGDKTFTGQIKGQSSIQFGNTGATFLGQWFATTTSTTNCRDRCAATDTTFGFAGGECFFAWHQDLSLNTCTDATNETKYCACIGVN